MSASSVETVVVQEGTFKGMNRMEYYLWEVQEEGWFGCAGGYGTNNNLWEGEDMGPFENREEVLKELKEHYENP